MLERRRYPRFELKIDGKYRIVGFEEVSKKTRTQNISAEGLCFESDKALKVGTRLALQVPLEEKEPTVSLIGEVKWSQELKSSRPKEKRFINGLKLLDVPKSDEGRFLKYYCDRMVEKLAAYLKM